MKFQIGDKVLVKLSDEEGEVIDIVNDKMVMVDVRGVKFPAYIDQLDFPYFKRFTQKKLVPQKKEKQYAENIKKEKTVTPRTSDGIWLSFLPKFSTDEFGDDVVESLKVHLINRTSEGFLFNYSLQFFGKPNFELKGEVIPFSDFYLHDVRFEDMNDSPAFTFEFSLPQQQKGKAEFFETAIKLKPKQLFDKIESIKLKGEATFTYKLFDQYPDKKEEARLDLTSLTARGIKVYNAKDIRSHLPPARSVVDLHIEKLTDDWQNLSSTEILDIQLREFEKWYELALAHHQPTLTIIHGVGKGVLRNEIHEILRLKKEVGSFVNQYNASFGYGATEIYFSPLPPGGRI